MRRREFISGLGLAPLFGVPSFLEDNAPKEDRHFEQQESYKGFDIYWSKFLNHADSEKITGFWIGWNDKENIGFHACIGGYSGDYRLGAIFNTCVLADHKFLTIRSSEKDKEEEKLRAYNLLKEEIDNYYKPKKIQAPEFKFSFSGFRNAKD